jgi:Methyltransferase domain
MPDPRAKQMASTARKLALMALNRPTILEDPYIAWLELAQAGMQHRGNFALFDQAIQAAPKGFPMFEVGSFAGLSTNIIQYLKRKHGRTEELFTADKWIFEGSENPLPAAAGLNHDQLRAFVMDSYRRNVEALSPGDLPHTIEATADEFFELWAQRLTATDVFGREVQLGGEFGFCFIDGNHTYPYAKADFDNCDRNLARGGLILFDDSNDESDWEVRKVIEEIKASPRYEIVGKNPNYLVKKL